MGRNRRRRRDPDSRRTQKRAKYWQHHEQQGDEPGEGEGQRVEDEGQRGEGEAQHVEGKGQKPGYTMSATKSEMFDLYYKTLGIVPEGEWEMFAAYTRKPLPSSFRITGFKSHARELLRIIQDDYLSNLVDVNVDDMKIEPKSLPWYPDELAWQINLDRKSIRKIAVLEKLHNFLVQETDSGNISRQETVSMIPPLVLDVQPHHRVLDMCAAPGSKTSQLIELLHADENQPIPTGFVVANDQDNKRCYLMVHQVKRLESPCFMIINHDASQLPNMRITPYGEKREWLKYDRVLVDVPCSGDGTTRKNPDIWTRWNPGIAHHISMLQGRILRRGLEVLEVGGRLVYSTCSLNPVENEAVIAHVLTSAEGSVELLDVSEQLPGLKYTKGLTKWKLMSRECEFFETYDDVPDRFRTQMHPQHFPPENVEALGLERCMRVLAHHQDTGGFFIAVMTKTRDLPWMKQTPTVQPPDVSTADSVTKETDKEAGDAKKPDGNMEKDISIDDSANSTDATPSADVAPATEGTEMDVVEGKKGNQKRGQEQYDNDDNPRPWKKQKYEGYKEDPYIFFEEWKSIWPPIKSFYGMDDSFPTGQLMVRCKEGKKRNIYITSAQIKDLIQYNDDRIRFINLGLKLWTRSTSATVDCNFRLAQSGVHILGHFLKSRTARISQDELITLMSQENPFLSRFSRATSDRLKEIGEGSCLFIYEPKGSDACPNCKIVLSGWRGKVSCRLFMPRFERAHFLRLCGQELKSKDEIMAEKEAKVKPEAGEVDNPSSSATTCEGQVKDEHSQQNIEGQEISSSSEQGDRQLKAEPNDLPVGVAADSSLPETCKGQVNGTRDPELCSSTEQGQGEGAETTQTELKRTETDLPVKANADSSLPDTSKPETDSI